MWRGTCQGGWGMGGRRGPSSVFQPTAPGVFGKEAWHFLIADLKAVRGDASWSSGSTPLLWSERTVTRGAPGDLGAVKASPEERVKEGSAAPLRRPEALFRATFFRPVF